MTIKELLDELPDMPEKPTKEIPQEEPIEETTHLQENQKSIFRPYPGFQTNALMATEKEIFMGGGRAGGKSYVMLAMPTRFLNCSSFRGLIIRKTTKQLRDLIRKAKGLYLKAFPGTKWKERDQLFEFPSGAVIEFNYLETADDYDQYHGQEFDFIGIDEGTEYGDLELIISKMRTCLRGGDPNIPKWIRITGNPGGPGLRTIRKRYTSQAKSGEQFTARVVVGGEVYEEPRRWFLSTVDDNPSQADYKKELMMAVGDNETLRKQWIDGDFNTTEGLAFNEFDLDKHICKSFPIPNNWYRIKAADWGYQSMAVCLWFAVDPEGTRYVYREYTSRYKTADIFQCEVNQLEKHEQIHLSVLDGSAWSARGEIGETPGDTMCRLGGRWTPADRSPGSRTASKLLVHRNLAVNKELDKPNLIIFEECKELISELSSLQIDSNNPEDIDRSKKTSIPDHAYDALRYGLTALPNMDQGMYDFHSPSEEMPPVLDPVFNY